MDIVFACEKDDYEFKNLINNTFSDVEELENYSLSGMEEMLLFLVPIASLSIQIAEFIIAHLSRDDKDRYVIINGKKKTFKGFSKDEIIDILRELK